MGSGASLPSDKKIVVVGGGYAGAYLCVDLLKAGANFVLIDPKTYFYHNVASVRAVVDTGYIEKLFIPYEKTFGDKFKKGKVKQIQTAGQKVILDSGEEIQYDVLVLATGNSVRAPYKYDPDAPSEDHNKTICADYAQKVNNASRVVVVGGGPVGSEIAAEVAHKYPDKEVTLIHSGEELIYKGTAPKFQKSLQQKLKNKGIKLVLGQKVSNLNEIDNSGPSDVRTDDGSSYPADFVFICTGSSKTDLEYAKDSLGDSFDEKGLLKVNEHLQVSGHDNIFAMGDCCNADVMKLAALTRSHREAVFHNIKAFLNQSSMKKYKPDAGPHYTIGVSLGPKDGVLIYNGMVLPDFVITSFKSKDMMVGQFWKDLKQTPPK